MLGLFFVAGICAAIKLRCVRVIAAAKGEFNGQVENWLEQVE